MKYTLIGSMKDSDTRGLMKEEHSNRTERYKATEFILVLTLIFAALQSPIEVTFVDMPFSGYYDDVLLVILSLLVSKRCLGLPGLPVVLFFAWNLATIMAFYRSSIPYQDAFILYRQVTVPSLLIYAGMALTSHEWNLVKKVTIIVGVVNGFYMVLEILNVHLLDPTRLSTFNDARAVIRNGLPSYYFYWIGEGPLGQLTGTGMILRMGGILLNPPMAGLVIAAAAIFIWYDKKIAFRKTKFIIFSILLFLTFSRAGWLVALTAILLPTLAKKIGKVGTIVIMLPSLWFVGTRLAEHGNSVSHAEGLVTGIKHAVAEPVGHGFGLIGNYLKGQGITRDSESLLGIAFSAMGFVAVLIVLLLMVTYWSIATSEQLVWEAAVGLGIVLAALFSETAGGLNGTVPLWLAAGVAFAKWRSSASDRTIPQNSRKLMQ